MYSQHEEEQYILEFCKNMDNGTLIDIGAFHPETFSNTRALIEKGWDGHLVEASEKCIGVLKDFYKGNDKVLVHHVALNSYDGEMTFYDSAGAVGTGCKQHYDIWKDTQLDFQEVTISCLSWKTFYRAIGKPRLDFINIDVEGMDHIIFEQINLDETQTTLVCIERTYGVAEILEHLTRYNFSLILVNGENIIAGREIKVPEVTLDIQNGILR